MNYRFFSQYAGAGGSVIHWDAMLQARKLQVPFPMLLDFLIHPFLPIALWPSGLLSLKQKWVRGILMRLKGGRHVMLPPYHHLWVECLENVGALGLTTLRASATCYKDRFALFYDSVRSLLIHLPRTAMKEQTPRFQRMKRSIRQKNKYTMTKNNKWMQ
jgi:hypothetical protein